MSTFLKYSSGRRVNLVHILFLLTAIAAMFFSLIIGFIQNIQPTHAAVPTFTLTIQSLTGGNTLIAVIFSEGVSGTSGGSTVLDAADFTVAGTDGLTISSVDHTAGGDVAILTMSGTLAVAGAGEVTIACAGTAIYDDNSTNACVQGATDVNSATTDAVAPTISTTYSCDSDNDGDVDRIQATFDERIIDGSVTPGNLEADNDATNDASGEEVPSSGNTATGGCDGAADDTDSDDDKYRFDLTTGIAGTEAAYLHNVTLGITDLVGNQLATGDGLGTETDKALPVLSSVVLSSASNRNRLTFTYTEAITVTGGNGASSAARGDMTGAGSVVAFGSFATAGNATVPTTLNTLGGSGTATLTIDLADQAAGYLVTVASPGTELAGVFTPIASAQLVDANSNQVSTAAASPTASGGGSWDLTRPTITSATITDATGNNGKVDRVTFVLDSAMRDSNVTNADATLGGGSGIFTTDTANDSTTTFNLSADTLGVDTSATAADFLYSGATTKITDLAGNLLDTATDGQIVAGDTTEVDGALPILVSVALSVSGNRNRFSFTYSEAMTIASGNGASSASRGDLTAAGTITGFGSAATTGNTTVPTTLNTIGGSGSAVITVDLADQAGGFMNTASTTELSGVFTAVGSVNVVDAVAQNVNTANAPTISGGGSWDLTKPTLTSVTISDAAGNNGKVDRAVLVLNSPMRDSNLTNGNSTLGGGAGTFTTGTANDATTTFNLTADTLAVDTSATAADFLYTGVTTKITDRAGNLLDTATDGQIASGDVTETDGANPILISATLSLTGNRNRLSFVYSEAMAMGLGNGASNIVKGDITTAGSIAGFGTAATTGDVTVNTALNTVGGNGTATLTVDLADQAAAFMASTSTTEPSGVFTPVSNVNVVDLSANLQVNASNTPTILGGGSWDLTKPAVTSVTISDAAGNNGRVDRAVLVLDTAMRDANVTDANGTLGAGAGTFTTGTANDATTTFNLTADTLAVDTSATAADFLYSGATTLITDRAGNLLDTTTDGQIASGDATEVDGASPILTAVVLSSASNRNRVSFSYSENITVTNGASTTVKGDITAAGTVAGFGSFATAGNTSVLTTLNTVGGNGTSTLTLDLADQAAGYLVGTSTTEPSGVFTPVGSAQVVDGASNQVATGNTPTASGGGSWDLTKPTLTSVTISDAAGNNGQVDRAVIVFNSSIRDANVTNADATLGSGGTTTGTFTTGTANDATTTFNRTADDNGVDTSATAGDFVYSGATSKITDLAGNLVDLTTDGQIASGDATEVDAANPILTGVALSLTGNRNRLSFSYSENITVTGGDGASTTARGDMTAAGTVVAFGGFATTGDATVPTTLNTLGGSGTSTLTLDLADQASGRIITVASPGTEVAGVFTPVASAQLADAASNQVNVANTPTASGGASWDLTRPTLTSVTISDAAGANGKVDRAVLLLNSAMRDSNVTNADATLGGGAGTFTTGTANDATTTFNLTADTLAVDTSATAADFLYSGATNLITDRAGNLLDTTTDGQVASGDSTETDGASPIVTSWELDLSVSPGTLTTNYSESVDASTQAPTTITVQDAITATTSVTLTGGTPPAADGASIVLDLSITDVNSLNANSSLATSTLDTFLVFTNLMIDDLATNDVIAIVNGVGIAATSVGVQGGRSPCFFNPSLCNGGGGGGETIITTPEPEEAPEEVIIIDETGEEVVITKEEVQFHLISQDPVPAPPLPENVQVGSLIKLFGTSAVYFVDADNRRHAFATEAIFFSWFPDFSNVMELSSEVLASIPLGSNVMMRPGTWLIKIQSDPKTYAVEPYGVIRWVQTEEDALRLFGQNWNQRIIDVDTSLFFNYQIAEPLDSTSNHPIGSLIRYIGDSDVYYVSGDTIHLIGAEVFAHNLFRDEFVIKEVSSLMIYTQGELLPKLSIDTLLSLR